MTTTPRHRPLDALGARLTHRVTARSTSLLRVSHRRGRERRSQLRYEPSIDATTEDRAMTHPARPTTNERARTLPSECRLSDRGVRVGRGNKCFTAGAVRAWEERKERGRTVEAVSERNCAAAAIGSISRGGALLSRRHLSSARRVRLAAADGHVRKKHSEKTTCSKKPAKYSSMSSYQEPPFFKITRSR